MRALQGSRGPALWDRMYNSFGYLNDKGYQGHRFPIFIGEVGSGFETQTDIDSLNDMQAWFLAEPNTGIPHSPVSHCVSLKSLAGNRCGRSIMSWIVLAPHKLWLSPMQPERWDVMPVSFLCQHCVTALTSDPESGA